MDQRRFPWEKYCIYGMVGGEGMTEALRDYLQRRFRKVRSGYGATDIQIGIAGETDFSVWLRKELIRDPALARRLLGEDEKRIPMVFQYNPLDHFIEVNEQSELVITVNNQSVMSPRLRYNVKDEGKILDFSAAMDILRSGGRDDRQFSAKYKDFLKIPLLFLFGRKDSTISYMGANIYPQDIEYGLYKNAEHAGLIESFCLSLEEQSNLECRPVIYVELRKDAKLDGHRKDEMVDSIRKGMVEHLAQVSRDFAQSLKEDQTTAEIHIRLCEFGTGIFKDKGNRIKNVYLIKGKTL
jgi:phenylacetate-CoA ligase